MNQPLKWSTRRSQRQFNAELWDIQEPFIFKWRYIASIRCYERAVDILPDPELVISLEPCMHKPATSRHCWWQMVCYRQIKPKQKNLLHQGTLFFKDQWSRKRSVSSINVLHWIIPHGCLCWKKAWHCMIWQSMKKRLPFSTKRSRYRIVFSLPIIMKANAWKNWIKRRSHTGLPEHSNARPRRCGSKRCIGETGGELRGKGFGLKFKVVKV